uniref:Uncharacterized protein n=1 Tax=Glossina pallidipes TaxID=7398 RepID=A0A1A9ZFJ4_GLOPL
MDNNFFYDFPAVPCHGMQVSAGSIFGIRIIITNSLTIVSCRHSVKNYLRQRVVHSRDVETRASPEESQCPFHTRLLHSIHLSSLATIGRKKGSVSYQDKRTTSPSTHKEPKFLACTIFLCDKDDPELYA